MQDGDAPPEASAAPALSRHSLLRAIQILGWLFFRPSAWRHAIAGIAPDLAPDFALLDLRPAHWRDPALRRVLGAIYVILPLLAGCAAGLLLWGAGAPRRAIEFSVAQCLVGSLASSLVMSLAGSVAVGAFGGALGSLALSLIFGAVNIRSSTVAFGSVSSLIAVLLVGGVLGIVGGISGNLAGQLAQRSLYQRATFSWSRELGAVVGSIMLNGLLYGLLVGLLGSGAGIILCNTAGSIVCGRHPDRWRYRIGAALLFGLALGGVYTLIIGSVRALVEGTGHSWQSGVALGIAGGFWLGSFFALPYALGRRVASGWAGAVAGALAVGMLCTTGILIVVWQTTQHPALWLLVPISLGGLLLGLALNWWRPLVLYPLATIWNLALYRLDEQRRQGPFHIRWNATFWDDDQRLPFYRLDEHLLLVLERDPCEGERMLHALMRSRQRWAAQQALIELDARRLEDCRDVDTIAAVHRQLAAGDLGIPASALLHRFSRISEDVAVALQQSSTYHQRLALRLTDDQIDGVRQELARRNERYVIRFRPIGAQWQRIIADHIRELARTIEQRQEIESPYVVGVPLTAQQEIFVGRIDISARIEHLLLSRQCPPLLLYGQRRMGKTSLLNNLGRLLPSAIVPLFVDLQGPITQANDHAGLLAVLAQSITSAAQSQRAIKLPPLTRQDLQGDPFPCFDQWLRSVERCLEPAVALLMLDEFEVLGRALAGGRFDEERVLGMLRHLIQHRSRWRVLLAGSHTFDALDRWASYLINVQVVHIGYLSEAETFQLVEHPVKDFALCYEAPASRRVFALTRGHPALVQLLCSEIVGLKNTQAPAVRRRARLADVESAVPDTLRRGTFFFTDIGHQAGDTGSMLLRALAAYGEGAVVGGAQLPLLMSGDSDAPLQRLIQYELIEPIGDGYRFQVELIRRWFAQ